jgi:peptide-methionine (S)-S-oxide reductase
LLKLFWTHHDPTKLYKTQYKSAIYYEDDEQKAAAHESFKEVQSQTKAKLVTTIEAASTFYTAENYHQKYNLRKHSTLIKDLKWTNADLLDSPLAAKLNGFLSGKGSLELFERLSSELKLTESQADYVRNYLK